MNCRRNGLVLNGLLLRLPADRNDGAFNEDWGLNREAVKYS